MARGEGNIHRPVRRRETLKEKAAREALKAQIIGTGPALPPYQRERPSPEQAARNAAVERRAVQRRTAAWDADRAALREDERLEAERAQREHAELLEMITAAKRRRRSG